MNQLTTEDSAFFKSVEGLITEREALRSALLAAVISELVGVAGMDVAMGFCNGKDLPDDIELSPWAETAITVLGMRGKEQLQ